MDYKPHTKAIIARLGVAATWTPSGGNATAVTGIFSNPYQAINLGTGEISSANPTFAAYIDDVPNVKAGDALAIGAVNYKVIAPEPDTVGGWVLLQLEKQ